MPSAAPSDRSSTAHACRGEVRAAPLRARVIGRGPSGGTSTPMRSMSTHPLRALTRRGGAVAKRTTNVTFVLVLDTFSETMSGPFPPSTSPVRSSSSRPRTRDHTSGQRPAGTRQIAQRSERHDPHSSSTNAHPARDATRAIGDIADFPPRPSRKVAPPFLVPVRLPGTIMCMPCPG